eukprot:scaffold4146_cov63-Phaeocystis_antarctica.AAC.8
MNRLGPAPRRSCASAGRLRSNLPRCAACSWLVRVGSRGRRRRPAATRKELGLGSAWAQVTVSELCVRLHVRARLCESVSSCERACVSVSVCMCVRSA